MAKRKIAFVIPNLNSGGAQRVVCSLANELVQYYNITIITFIKQESFYELHPAIKLLYCSENIDPSKNLWKALTVNMKLLISIKSHVQREKVELLVGFLTSANILASFVASNLKIPTIICERNNPKLDRLSIVWRILRQISYKKANLLIVQTQQIKDFYSNWYSQEQVRILPNPISKELSDLRDLGIKREKILLNVGRLSPQKGHDLLIKSFALTNNEGWKLIIVGEGELRNKLEILIEDLNLGNKVFLVGKRKNIHTYYNEASIFAFSSHFEGFPNALIEALHFGLACISTDCPTGPSDLIINNINGFLVPTDNLSQYTLKLNTLMENLQIREKFSLEASKSVQEFEIEHVMTKWKILFDEVLNK